MYHSISVAPKPDNREAGRSITLENTFDIEEDFKLAKEEIVELKKKTCKKLERILKNKVTTTKYL